MKSLIARLALVIAGLAAPLICAAQAFVNVSSQVTITRSGLVLDRATDTFNSVVTIANISSAVLNGPLELVISNISPSTVTLANSTGQSPSGSPFITVSVPADGLLPGASIANVLLKFSNPGRAAFTFTASLSTIVIQPEPMPPGVAGPLIQSLPPAAALVGTLLSYQVIASSANPSSLVFSLSTAPPGMTINATTGLMQWTPAANEAGDQPITIAAQDSTGQISQSFTLSVFGATPVTTATILAASGGVITVTDPGSPINGLTISFPAGALSSNTIITISALTQPPTLGGAGRFFMAGFSISPNGIALASPASVTLPYNPSQFGTQQGIPLEKFLGVYFIQASTGGLQFLNSYSVDTVNHVLTASVPHFSVLEFTNVADLCPPPITGSLCGDSYTPPSPASLLVPTVLVHGFQQPNAQGVGLGTEGTWGNLRTLLSQLDSGQAGRIDAWRFDWDAYGTPFESSAANLDTSLAYIESVQQTPVVNIVAHSFGGILARTYIAGLGAGQAPYHNDVNRIMTIGTPHTGIGGNLSTTYANACAKAAQLLPTNFSFFPVTCFEAGSGQVPLPGGNSGEGNFLRNLNTMPLPGPPAVSTAPAPWFMHIKGQTLDTRLPPGSIALHSDDGLITIAGATLCGGSPVNVCSGSFVDDTDVIAANASSLIGLCHSGFPLLGTTCDNSVNIPMVAVKNTSHPLWDTICSFLGCLPAVNVTVTGGTVANPAGVVTSDPAGSNCGPSCTPPGINCGSSCAALFQSGTIVTLTATAAAGYVFKSWGGACTGTSAACVLDIGSIDDNLGGYQVTANFTKSGSTYLFTGIPFNTFESTSNGFNSLCPPICNLSASITLAQPLPPNLTSFLLVTPVAFSFNDGSGTSVTESNTNPTSNYFAFETDSQGNITQWQILIDGAQVPGPHYAVSTQYWYYSLGGGYVGGNGSTRCIFYVIAGTSGLGSECTSPGTYEVSVNFTGSNIPGTWVLAPD